MGNTIAGKYLLIIVLVICLVAFFPDSNTNAADESGSSDLNLENNELVITRDPEEGSEISATIIIESQPLDTTVIAGEKFIFYVSAESTTGSKLTYLWQYSKDHGENWIDTTRNRDNYSTTATVSLDGRLYRCIVTDADGNSIVSDSAQLTVEPAIEIVSQTDSQSVNVGERYTFTVTAKSRTGNKLSYLWQYSKNQSTWTNTTRTFNNYGTYATTAMDGCFYRCRITDENNNIEYSIPVMLRVRSDITITSQPTAQTVKAGEKFTFRVAATGSSLTYLWQYSKDGGTTWINTSRTRNNYGTYATTSLNGRMYRCVITDSSSNTVITDVAELIVE